MDEAKNGEDVDLNFEIETLENVTSNDSAQPIQEIDVSSMNANGQNESNEEEQKRDDTVHSKSGSVSTIKALFGNIKKYEYPKYVPPIIDMDAYFDVDRWKTRRMDALSDQGNRRKKKATTAVMEDRRETFPINPAQCQMTTKAFKLNLSMTEHFGLSVEEIVAILEAAAPQSKLAAKLKQFLEIKMPRGFPIQLEMPLFHVLKAKVTFQNFEHINPSDDLFAIPQDYKEVEKKENASPADNL